MRLRTILFILALVVGLFSFVMGYNILVWDKDEGDQYEDYDTSQLIGSEENLMSALEDNGETPTIHTGETLPTDISSYDIIYVCTGWYAC